MKTTVAIFTLFLSVLQADEMPLPELARLQEQRAIKIAEIDRIYIGQLEKLKSKYMKQSELESANLVNEIIELMNSPLQEIGKKTTRWEWGSGGILTLRPNGVATHTIWKGLGRWQRNDDGSILLKSDPEGGKVFKIVFENGVGNVTLPGKEGSKTTIKLLN
jgi:hypothetical protein